MSNRMAMSAYNSNLVSIDELNNWEVPPTTRTFHPIPHYDLATFIRSTATEILKHEVVREHYAVSKDGQRMFGMQVFGDEAQKCPVCKATGRLGVPESAGLVSEDCPTCNGTGWEPNEYGFGIAFRSSYDKSMSVGIAAGFNVFICDNLSISGEIKILRKHTQGVWEDIDQTLVHTLFRKRHALEDNFAKDVSWMKNREMSVHDGWRMLGFLLGNKVLSITQTSDALRRWHERLHVDTIANAWGFYADTTQALKTTPPHRILEAHRGLHECVKLELQ